MDGGSTMKKIIKFLCIFLLAFSFTGCGKPKDYEEVVVTMDEVHDMMEHQKDFFLLVERKNCPFCEKIHEYIDKTKQEHPGIKVYVLDTSDFKFSKKKDEEVLSSKTKEGKLFLKSFPYFMYTPTIYKIQEGDAVEAGVGFDEATKQVKIWDVDSVADFDKAYSRYVWLYLEEDE